MVPRRVLRRDRGAAPRCGTVGVFKGSFGITPVPADYAAAYCCIIFRIKSPRKAHPVCSQRVGLAQLDAKRRFYSNALVESLFSAA